MNDLSNPYLKELLDETESLFPQKDFCNPRISSAAVAWHLDHLLKVINRVYETMKKSDPAEYKNDFKIARAILFAARKIPRGAAKSPKSVLPPKEISMDSLHEQLELARNYMKSIDQLDKNQHFKHFSFGFLNRSKTKTFLEIHTIHHLDIIKDIIAK